MKENIVVEKSYQFALKVIKLYQILQEQREFVLSKQVLRSGTSIGANIQEATAACSRKDFHSKMSIASKEARETHYWLRLLQDSKIGKIDYQDYLNEAKELIAILSAIVKTIGQSK